MDICLVTMPFASVERPSMALGMLKGALAGTGPETGQEESLPGSFPRSR